MLIQLTVNAVRTRSVTERAVAINVHSSVDVRCERVSIAAVAHASITCACVRITFARELHTVCQHSVRRALVAAGQRTSPLIQYGQPRSAAASVAAQWVRVITQVRTITASCSNRILCSSVLARALISRPTHAS